MANTNVKLASYKAVGSSGTHTGMIHFDEVELEEVPYVTSTTGTTAMTLVSGKAYYVHPAGAITFTLPDVSSDVSVLHNIIVQFDTYASGSTTVNFQATGATGVYLDPNGVQTLESSKQYTASLVYRMYWTGSTTAWKWVLTITEDYITTHS